VTDTLDVLLVFYFSARLINSLLNSIVTVQERLRRKSLGQKKETYIFFYEAQKSDVVAVT